MTKRDWLSIAMAVIIIGAVVITAVVRLMGLK